MGENSKTQLQTHAGQHGGEGSPEDGGAAAEESAVWPSGWSADPGEEASAAANSHERERGGDPCAQRDAQ